MKFDSDKVFSLINKNENSLSGFALKIGMSHTGLKAALNNKSLGVKSLIKIAVYFNKPIEYFFTTDNGNVLNEPEADFKAAKKASTFSCIDCIEKQKQIEDLRGALADKEELLELYRGKKEKSSATGT